MAAIRDIKHDGYEPLDLPCQGEALLSLAHRILEKHAPDCGIPNPHDPGKAAAVYALFRYGLKRKGLDWTSIPWRILLRDEAARPSSSAGQPELPPLEIIADANAATVYWNPAVTYKEAYWHLCQMSVIPRTITAAAVYQRLKRADPPPVWLNDGGKGRGREAWLRLTEVLRVYGVQARTDEQLPR